MTPLCCFCQQIFFKIFYSVGLTPIGLWIGLALRFGLGVGFRLGLGLVIAFMPCGAKTEETPLGLADGRMRMSYV